MTGETFTCHNEIDGYRRSLGPLLGMSTGVAKRPDARGWYLFTVPASPNDRLAWDCACVVMARVLFGQLTRSTGGRPDSMLAVATLLSSHRLKRARVQQFWYCVADGRLLFSLQQPTVVLEAPVVVTAA